MVFSRTITIFCLMFGLTCIGLSGCSSTTDAFTLTKDQERWFCTPKGEEEWFCDESSGKFEQLAQQNKLVQDEQEEKLESSDTNLTSPTFVVKGATNEQRKEPERLSGQEASVQKTEPAGLESVASKPEIVSTDEAATSSNTLTDEPNSLEVELKEVAKDGASEQARISSWVVQLGAYSTEPAAKELIRKVGRGDVFRTEVRGRYYFTVVVTGFSQKFEAEQFSNEIGERQVGVSPWVRTGASLRQVLTD